MNTNMWELEEQREEVVLTQPGSLQEDPRELRSKPLRRGTALWVLVPWRTCVILGVWKEHGINGCSQRKEPRLGRLAGAHGEEKVFILPSPGLQSHCRVLVTRPKGNCWPKRNSLQSLSPSQYLQAEQWMVDLELKNHI